MPKAWRRVFFGFRQLSKASEHLFSAFEHLPQTFLRVFFGFRQLPKASERLFSHFGHLTAYLKLLLLM
ncbi:hypothetical protein [Capnocytophaga felis]|uniref:hypothetical protein n=1 Tax=Capnocytophaga felis TaxID=2267611 RepID=UPI0012D343EF|nr:hypothetical protein [Capnocytophaga felis]